MSGHAQELQPDRLVALTVLVHVTAPVIPDAEIAVQVDARKPVPPLAERHAKMDARLPVRPPAAVRARPDAEAVARVLAIRNAHWLVNTNAVDVWAPAAEDARGAATVVWGLAPFAP